MKRKGLSSRKIKKAWEDSSEIIKQKYETKLEALRQQYIIDYKTFLTVSSYSANIITFI